MAFLVRMESELKFLQLDSGSLYITMPQILGQLIYGASVDCLQWERWLPAQLKNLHATK